MRRAIHILIISLVLSSTGLILAQEEPAPVATEEAGVPLPAEPIAPPPAPVTAIEPAALQLLISIRTDMELLAAQTLGTTRPVGWSGSLDVSDPQLPLLARLDLELLAGTILGPDQRPAGWFGPVPSTPLAIVRDVRHDLELLADAINAPNVRPPGWSGSDPLLRCERAVQSLVNLLERGGVFSLDVSVDDPAFCHLAEIQASRFVEQTLVAASQPAIPVSGPADAGIPAAVTVDGQFPVAYLDRFASQRVGSLPFGEPLTPVARSFTQFSKMMLVRGQGFEVFMDYRDSTLTDAQFTALPDVNTISVSTSCAAVWCQAPAG